MSKNGKSGKAAPESVTSTEVEVEAEVPADPPKKVDKERLRGLFDQYKSLDKKDEEIRLAQEKVKQARSDVVKQILETAGRKKLKYEGREITIMSRKNKAQDNETFFFRGNTEDADALEVD